MPKPVVSAFSRRAFLASAGAATASLQFPALARARTAAQDSRMHIVDMGNGAFLDPGRAPDDLTTDTACRAPAHGFFDSLTRAGVDTVIRSYSDRNGPGLPCENVSLLERDILEDHGLALAVLYRFRGDPADRYTGASAERDAAFVLDRARALKQPEQSTIFFAIENPAGRVADSDIAAYFDTIAKALRGRYKIGVHAPGAQCALLRNKGLAKTFWVPEAPVSEGTRAFLNSGNWTMYQHKTGITHSRLATGFGPRIGLSGNMLNPAAGNTIGAFRRDGSIVTYDRARLDAVAGNRFWVTADQLNVRVAPGGRRLAHVCSARVVHVLEITGDWARIDLDEDGMADGFCHRDYLVPLGHMPEYKEGCVPIDI